MGIMTVVRVMLLIVGIWQLLKLIRIMKMMLLLVMVVMVVIVSEVKVQDQEIPRPFLSDYTHLSVLTSYLSRYGTFFFFSLSLSSFFAGRIIWS